MAFKLALLSFEIDSFNGLKHDLELDRDLGTKRDTSADAIQPLVVETFEAIKECTAMNISGMFNLAPTRMENIGNVIYLATSTFEEETQLNDGTRGIACTTLMVKFYRLYPSFRYKVNVDIEQMPSSNLSVSDSSVFSHGIKNEDIAKLVDSLNKTLNLKGRLEYLPCIKRGRLDAQYFEALDDNRIKEVDYTEAKPTSNGSQKIQYGIDF